MLLCRIKYIPLFHFANECHVMNNINRTLDKLNTKKVDNTPSHKIISMKLEHYDGTSCMSLTM